MHNKFNHFLIVFVIAIVIGAFYSSYIKDLKSEASSLESSVSGEVNSLVNQISDDISSNTAFIQSLASLNSIKIDTSLLQNSLFSKLIDNSVVLDSVPYGRDNPFAPIGPGGTTSLSNVVTNIPTQITSSSANLNGTINNQSAGSTLSYFEYGLANNLDKATPVTSQSLVGTFMYNLSGLTSKTTYFYRAVSKINGVLFYGETISFTTN